MTDKALKKILVSACLYGEVCRYDAKCCPSTDENFVSLKKKGILVPVCPEVLGGLETPRTPCEIVGDRVISKKGVDCTEQYEKGAQIARQTAIDNDVVCCILKSKSPSCGIKSVYDGTFTRTLREGRGISAELLASSGFKVFDESEIGEAIKLLRE